MYVARVVSVRKWLAFFSEGWGDTNFFLGKCDEAFFGESEIQGVCRTFFYVRLLCDWKIHRRVLDWICE